MRILLSNRYIILLRIINSLGKRCMVMSIFIFPLLAQAQFTGGNNDGSVTMNINAQYLGEEIFKGGNNDGSNTLNISAQILGESIYVGGYNDGSAFQNSFIQSLGESLFIGGSNDGSVAHNSSSQSLGESIYFGGYNDGSVSQNSFMQSLGESLFIGGSNDGSVAHNSSNQSLGESIYTGGNNDGSVSQNSFMQSLGESLFKGGSNDGSVSNNSSSQSLGESIFAGGLNDGSSLIQVNSQSFGENIFKGGQGSGFTKQLLVNASLPVTLISFSSKWQYADALCSWTMADESDAKGYVLEQSLDGLTFDSIYYTKSSNKVGIAKYIVIDADRWNLMGDKQTVYYRLKLLALDGQIIYSPVSALNKIDGKTNRMEISIYPNPTQDYINISSKNEPSLSSISIYDATGKLVTQIKDRQGLTRVKLSNYAKGIYFLVLSTETEILFHQKFIIQ
jgi:hypothetical protein